MVTHLMSSSLFKIISSGKGWYKYQLKSYIANHWTGSWQCISCKSQFSTSKLFQNQEQHKQNFFGYQAVSHDEKREKVQSVFSNVASSYDLMNDVMSMGIHRYWKDYFVKVLSPTTPTKLLDVAGGTGDIAFRFLETMSIDTPEEPIPNVFDSNEKETVVNKKNQNHVTVLDINENMLNICKEKAKEMGYSESITCIQGTAESLPFEDSTFDAYTIAFGIRNVPLIDQALSEAFRVLKTGGRFLCLEFSHVRNPLLSKLYDLYSFQVIPCMGQIVARDWMSYQYLVESIRKFPTQEDFCDKIEDAGFSLVTCEDLLNGIVAIHSGYKI